MEQSFNYSLKVSNLKKIFNELIKREDIRFDLKGKSISPYNSFIRSYLFDFDDIN